MEFSTIGELCTVKGGKRLPKGASLVDYKTDHPYVRISDFENDYIDLNKIKYITDDVHEKISRYIINKGDIFLSIVGTIGLVDIIKENLDSSNLTENAVKIRSKNEELLDTTFMYYYLKSPMGQHEINIRTVGSTQPKLAITRIRKIPVPLVPIYYQRQIVNILSSIDEKVRVNNETIENLEELSQTLFKRWFIDFEFPDENGNPYRSTGGEFIKSSLGKIPRDWEVKSIDEIADLVSRGVTPKYNESSDDQIPIINQKVNKGNSLDLEYVRYYDGQQPYKADLFALPRDILINSLGQGTLGRVHMYNREPKKYLIDQHISIIRFITEVNWSYYYYLNLASRGTQHRLHSLITGSTGMIMLNITKIRKLELVHPTNDVLSKFSSMVHIYFNKIGELENQNENLIELRETLLPKLISGELELPEELEV